MIGNEKAANEINNVIAIAYLVIERLLPNMVIVTTAHGEAQTTKLRGLQCGHGLRPKMERDFLEIGGKETILTLSIVQLLG